MAEILKEWLTERLHRPIKWEALEFGEMMRNGYIVASVLHSYHVINEEKLFLIRPSNATIDIKSNWKYLSKWLHQVDVFLSDSELDNVMEGKGSALLRLFYQLFLHLDKRDRTNFLKIERKNVSELVEKLGTRFHVEKVNEDEEREVDHLSKPLLNERHYIEWQRKKAEQVKDTYEYVKHKYSKMVAKIEESKIPCWQPAQKPQKLPSKDLKDMEKFAQKHPCKYENYSYEKLLKMEEEVLLKKSGSTSGTTHRDYMSILSRKMSDRTDSEEFQKQIRSVLDNTLWDVHLGEDGAKADRDVAKKVLRLSQFEKQMCTKIMETKQQARNLAKIRIDAEREFAEQRDHLFNQYLDSVKEQIHLDIVEIDFERRRQNMLHQKLYGEKMKRKRKHYYEICYDTMLSIVDYATKYGHYTRLLGGDIPDHFIHEWKTLFFRKQPIFDVLEPMEDLLKERSMEEEAVPEEEEIIRLELDRQEAVNDSEFKEYHNYAYPWSLDLLVPNYDPESEERKYEYLGTRILGHVVYTLLEIKYPLPPPKPPAEIPDFKIKALVRCLPEKSIAVAMQTLLDKSKVHVVRVEPAINFCLRKFKLEMMGIVEIDLSYDKFMGTAQNENEKEFIRSLKADDEMYSKSSSGNVTALGGPIPPNCKLTQTPKTLPEEDMTLSAAADLGKYAYETLSFGDTLTDYLLSAMLVEYIKDQKGIEGFVIINYPNSYREAQILEETFSGREPPNEGELDDRDDIYLEESIAKHRQKIRDPFKDIRVSRIVNNPHKKVVEKPFESYFTCYLKLKETEDILQEYVIWAMTEENSELIDRFYAALGMNYSLYYEFIDKELLALICKYIIGDFSMPLKSCETLFGDGVLSVLDFPSSEDKRMKHKMVKPEVSVVKSRERLKRNSQARHSRSSQDIEVVKPESADETQDELTNQMHNEAAEEEAEIMSATTMDDVKLLAGEEDWDYGEIPISENIGIALATCWEEVEKAYVRDLEQLFFSKRLQMNCLVPYTRFIKDKMEQIITLPSHKQDLVSAFQKDYNHFEDNWRDVNLTKNEWHCRIKELQHKLYNICDERKMFSEQQKHLFIVDNWMAEEMITMTNTYISCMQTELNRSLSTFQALHDFYFTKLKKLPPHEKLLSKDLTKISRDVEEVPGAKKPVEDKVYKLLKTSFMDLLLKNLQLDFSNNPANMIVNNNVIFAMKVVKDLNDHYRSIVSREYSEVARMVPQNKKTYDASSEDSLNQEEIYKQNALKCVDEWLMGINGEMYRVNLRLSALQHKCYRDLKLFYDHILSAFMEVQRFIDTYYMNEIKSVDRLCKFFQMAVENSKKIPETLVLEQDTFTIDPNLLQFVVPEPVIDYAAMGEVVHSFEFKVSQLARLRSQFKIVAPTGHALQQAVVYLIQDFIFFGKESCEGSLFPVMWKQIDIEQVDRLVFSLFGENAYVDWRDFLIYCLNIRFPTVEELLELRHNFRCYDRKTTERIPRQVFLSEPLWYETDFDLEDRFAVLRKGLIKNFLFEMFETAEDEMNYSAFLLAFCKNVDPIAGFASALAMAIGKKTCYIPEECEDVVCKMIKLKQYQDECRACALDCSKKFLNALIENVVDICAGTTVIELPHTQEDEKDDKKGKKKGKGKKADTPTTPPAKVAAVKKEPSVTDEVKQTYICRPCEDVPAPEEKLAVEEERPEEAETEVFQDQNLEYTVSQDVLWNVLRICLPWHFVLVPEMKRTPYLDMVTEVMKRLEVLTENKNIFVSLFVSDPNVCKILHKVKKFTALNIVDEVRQVCHT